MPHRLALRTVTLLLQSRLSDAIRENSAPPTASPPRRSAKYPRPEYRVRIDWTCDPRARRRLVQRVFDGDRFLQTTLLTPEQVARVRSLLTRDIEQNSQENGYLLNQIAKKYRGSRQRRTLAPSCSSHRRSCR